MSEEIKTFSSGAQSSSSKPGYWMVPFCVLQAVAKRFDLGALKYDAHNWKRGCEDAAFMRDRFNHLFEHLMKFKEGGDEEDDMEGSIVAVLINAVFLTYWTITHPKEVAAAFPTEASAVTPAPPITQVLGDDGHYYYSQSEAAAQNDNEEEEDLIDQVPTTPPVPLDLLKQMANKVPVVPESADPTPRRFAQAFLPPAPQLQAIVQPKAMPRPNRPRGGNSVESC